MATRRWVRSCRSGLASIRVRSSRRAKAQPVTSPSAVMPSTWRPGCRPRPNHGASFAVNAPQPAPGPVSNSVFPSMSKRAGSLSRSARCRCWAGRLRAELRAGPRSSGETPTWSSSSWWPGERFKRNARSWSASSRRPGLGRRDCSRSSWIGYRASSLRRRSRSPNAYRTASGSPTGLSAPCSTA